MPRNGSGVYSHPFPDVVDGTTIESAVFNGNTSDVEQDLNTPRPIVAGGTGANNAHDAMIALKGEIAGQAVDNYATFPFADGCFYSIPGATDAPDGATSSNYFWGIAYGVAGLGGCSLEARNISGGGSPKYYREKVSGVWSAWRREAGSVADLDAAYVNVAGDIMAGSLAISSGDLIMTGGGRATFNDNSGLQWGTGTTALIGSGAGNALTAYVNSVPQFQVTGNGTVALGTVTAGNAGATGAYYFGNSGGKYLLNDANNFYLHDLPLRVSATAIWCGATAGTGTYYFGNSGTQYLQFDGSIFNLTGGLKLGAEASLYLPGPTYATIFFNSTNSAYLQYTNGGNFNFTGGTVVAPELASSARVIATTAVIAGSAGATGTYFFGNTGTKYLQYDGTNFNLVGGPLTVANQTITAGSGGATGAFSFGNTGARYLYYDGINFNLSGGPLVTTGYIKCGYGYYTKSGVSGAFGGDYFNFQWTGNFVGYVDDTNLGNVSFTSDYRIKKDVIDLPGMWDTVKALRPIKYTQAQFSPPSHVKFVAKETLAAKKEAEDNPEAAPREVSAAPLFAADDIERWGFIAHELQETLTPSAATGVKDSPDTVQSPNPWTVISALTKALQEAMTRIEALEAAP